MLWSRVLTIVVALSAPMPPRKRERSGASASDNIPSVLGELAQHAVTRTGLADTLATLHKRGLLADDVMQGAGAASLRRKIHEGMKAHAEAMTPYGKLTQQMDLGTPQLAKWSYCHPLALVHYLSSISVYFADLMRSVVVDRPLRIILYIDGCDPANPLRADRTRKIECIYWCFVDWPQWVLSRTGAWLIFGYVRTKLVDALPGGHSELMARVLQTFFNDDQTVHSFTRGVTMFDRDKQRFMTTAVFAGFLADDEAHTQLAGLKGAQGIKFCLKCANCTTIAQEHLDDYLVSVDCSDPERLDPNTNAHVFAMADELKALWDGGDAVEYERRSKTYGIKYVPNGLLSCMTLRTIYRPVDHCIADWMHMMCSGGVCGTELGLLLHVLRSQGISLEAVNEWVTAFTLPKKHGKVDPAWLAPRRLHDDGLQSLASTVLTLTPIILCFLKDHAAPRGIAPDHILCLQMMVDIIGILCLGADGAMQYATELRRLIVMHAKLFVTLYPLAAKPKFHHLLHLVDDMLFVGKLLSCFVCERLHRTTRKAALHVFRHMESTVLADVLNRKCAMVTQQHNLFKTDLLVNEVRVTSGPGRGLDSAASCVLKCGEIYINDIVWLANDVVCKVVKLWGNSIGEVVVQGHVLSAVDASDPEIVAVDDSQGTRFFPSADVVDACAWGHKSATVVRVIRPLSARPRLM